MFVNPFEAFHISFCLHYFRNNSVKRKHQADRVNGQTVVKLSSQITVLVIVKVLSWFSETLHSKLIPKKRSELLVELVLASHH